MCLTAVAAKQPEGECNEDSDADDDSSVESGPNRDSTEEQENEEASGLDPQNRGTSRACKTYFDGDVDEGTMALLKRIKDKKTLRHVREETELG